MGSGTWLQMSGTPATSGSSLLALCEDLLRLDFVAKPPQKLELKSRQPLGCC